MDTLLEKITTLLDKYENIVIAAHANPDLDAIGSAMGLSVVLNNIGKNSYVFLENKDKNKYSESVRRAVNKAEAISYIYPTEYKTLLDKETALVIVDTHQGERTEYPKLLDDIKNVIVLDHHIKNHSYIQNTELFYIDSTLSSMVELVTRFAEYHNVNLGSVVASIMLAGMEIDTNGFNTKTSPKTFEAAATLAKMGADNTLKQELLKESMDSYLKRADMVRETYIIDKNKAFCMMPPGEASQEELAVIAEELLKLDEVEMAFTIGTLKDGRAGVSARSVGDFDVCSIMKKLGGGGHANNAAAQIEGKTLIEVERMIRKILGEIE